MKKAKITLAVIAIAGVIGASLAFKAKSRTGGRAYFVTTVEGDVPTFQIKAIITFLGTPYYYTTIAGGEATVSAKFELVN